MQVVQTSGDLFGKCPPLIFLCIGSVDFSSKVCKGRSGLFDVCFAALAVEGDLSSLTLITARAVNARSQLNFALCSQ